MPTLIIDNVPASLYEQIQDLARARHRTAADMVLDLLESVFRKSRPRLVDPPLPLSPFLTEELHAAFSIPSPEGESTRPMRVAPPLPRAHDLQHRE